MQRSKSLLACQSCRKRKGKCSGVAPCSVCVKYGFTCEFVTFRRRRGPRPKAAQQPTSIDVATQSAARETQEHRPMDLSVNQPTDANSPNPLEPESPRDEASPVECEQMATPRPYKVQNDALGGIMNWDAMFPFPRRVDKGTMLNLMCHLIELFWTHVSPHQGPVLEYKDFYKSLQSGECPSYLCHAICAASAKFSCHSLLKPQEGETMVDDYFASMARTELQDVSDHRLLNRAQSFCLLILYEAGRGNGVQAWCDNATAASLIQIIQSDPARRDEASDATIIAYSFLAINRYLSRLGCPSLSDSVSPTTFPLISALEHGGHQEATLTILTMKLLDLLVTIKKTSAELIPEGSPPPWHVTSRFMSVHEQLGVFRLRHPDKVRFTLNIPPQELSDPSETGQRLSCALIWHCCVMSLNSGFISHRLDATRFGGVQAWNPLVDISHYRSTPAFFLEERINSSVESIKTVCSICCELMASEMFLFPPFLGYTCLQAALTLITLLNLNLSSPRWDLPRYLKITFAILGLSKELYAPAESWVEFLTMNHKAVACGFPNTERPEEPPFIELRVGPSSRNSGNQTQEIEDVQPIPTLPQNNNSESSPANSMSSWMVNYHAIIQEDLLAIAKTVHTPESNPCLEHLSVPSFDRPRSQASPQHDPYAPTESQAPSLDTNPPASSIPFPHPLEGEGRKNSLIQRQRPSQGLQPSAQLADNTISDENFVFDDSATSFERLLATVFPRSATPLIRSTQQNITPADDPIPSLFSQEGLVFPAAHGDVFDLDGMWFFEPQDSALAG